MILVGELRTLITLWVDYYCTHSPFLVPTVDGADIERVACPQNQSRAAVILIGSHQLVTGTGGGGGACYYTIDGHIIPRGKGGR